VAGDLLRKEKDTGHQVNTRTKKARKGDWGRRERVLR